MGLMRPLLIKHQVLLRYPEGLQDPQGLWGWLYVTRGEMSKLSHTCATLAIEPPLCQLGRCKIRHDDDDYSQQVERGQRLESQQVGHWRIGDGQRDQATIFRHHAPDDGCFMSVVARASPSTTLSSIVGNPAGPCAGKRIPPYRFCRGTT